MAELEKEYTDMKNVSHKVEHIAAEKKDQYDRERVIGELLDVLSKSERRGG